MLSHYLQEEKSVHSSYSALLLIKPLSCHLSCHLVSTFSSTFPFSCFSKCSFTPARQLPCFSLLLLLSLLGVKVRLRQLWSKPNVCIHSSSGSGQDKLVLLGDNTFIAGLSFYWHHCLHKPLPFCKFIQLLWQIPPLLFPKLQQLSPQLHLCLNLILYAPSLAVFFPNLRAGKWLCRQGVYLSQHTASSSSQKHKEGC